MTDTYMSDLESVIDVVADWMVKTVNLVTETLMPDDRPFGHVEQSPQEQLDEYFKFRGNQEAWAVYIGDLINQSNKKLQDSGLNPEQIQAVHVEDIIQKTALMYSYEMEELLRKSNGDVSPASGEVPASSRTVLPAGAGGQSPLRY
jgi:hypothetical protein